MNYKEFRGVVFLIKNETNRFLLEQRKEKSKLSKWSWVFPGGKMDDDEKPLYTVIREAKEEFGIDLNPSKCKKISAIQTHSGNSKNEV
jgi:8-oxo-dGTP pyrophosphatase MutT (NUDIX family)